jgi:hypothetical protein
MMKFMGIDNLLCEKQLHSEFGDEKAGDTALTVTYSVSVYIFVSFTNFQ